MSPNDLSPAARAEAAAGLMFELKAIDEVRAALDAQRATKLAALRRLNGGPPPSGAPPAPREPRQAPAMVPLKEAARTVGKHPDTVRDWCRVHGIGWKVGGRWMVDRSAFLAFLESRHGAR